jgi:hypothetical protein
MQPLRGALIGAVLALLLGTRLAARAAGPPEVKLNSFETYAEQQMVTTGNAQARVINAGATDGSHALQVEFQAAEWPLVRIVPPGPWDFRGQGELAVDVTNPGAQPLSIYIRLDDDPAADGWNHCQTGNPTIDPHATVTYSFPISSATAASLGMKTLPAWPGGRPLAPYGAAPLALGHIVALQIFLHVPPTTETLLIDNIRLRPSYPLAGIVDPFGQFTGAGWPGKITATDQFAAQRAAEAADLQAHPSLPDRDRFGGWASGPKQPATGFFRTAQVNGKWWLVTSDGGLFWSAGVDTVGTGDPTFIGGREAMFTGLPVKGDPLAAYFSTVQGNFSGSKSLPAFNFEAANLERKYGADAPQAWKTAALARLPSWGFNTIGAFSDPALYGNGQLPYCVQGWISGSFNTLTNAAAWGSPTPDPFDPRFAAAARDSLVTAFSQSQPSGPNLVANGEFTGKAAGWTHGDFNGAHSTLSAIPDGTPGIRWATTKTGSQSWSLQLWAPGLTLEEGGSYQLQFRARADASKPFGVTVDLDGTPDYRSFQAAQPALTTDWQTFTYPFTAKGTNPKHVRLLFDALNQIGDFDLADVTLRKVSGTNALKDDPWCLGYFVQNELDWGSTDSDASHYGLALAALAQTAAQSPAKQEFLRELQAKYADVSGLNTAWGTHYATWNALGPPAGTLTAAAKTDMSAFLSSLARRYFQTVRDQLRAGDPHHLYLGDRFGLYGPEVVAAAAEFCDVLSFNVYRPRLEPADWAFLNTLKVPALVSEFSFGATDRGMFDPGIIFAPDQATRAQMYQEYARSALALPAVVGCHWFEYADEPLTGRYFDGENSNFGFLSVTDTPFPEMVQAARAANQEIYRR